VVLWPKPAPALNANVMDMLQLVGIALKLPQLSLV
jgi:hypothetical protein